MTSRGEQIRGGGLVDCVNRDCYVKTSVCVKPKLYFVPQRRNLGGHVMYLVACGTKCKVVGAHDWRSPNVSQLCLLFLFVFYLFHFVAFIFPPELQLNIPFDFCYTADKFQNVPWRCFRNAQWRLQWQQWRRHVRLLACSTSVSKICHQLPPRSFSVVL